MELWSVTVTKKTCAIKFIAHKLLQMRLHLNIFCKKLEYVELIFALPDLKCTMFIF